MDDLIERNALEAKIRENSMRIRFFDPSVNCILHLIRYAPAVNRWILVEDALPEKDKSYITYAETTKYCNHNEIPEELRINILYFNGEEWYDEECIYYNVTHWMPLPSTEGLT